MTSGEQRFAAFLCIVLALGVLGAQHRAYPSEAPPLAAAHTFFKAERRASEAKARPPKSTGPLNLNTATAEALRSLPGIGPALSARIVAYREAHGPFQRVDALRRVSGIGPRTLARLRPLLTVRMPAAGEAPSAADGATSEASP